MITLGQNRKRILILKVEIPCSMEIERIEHFFLIFNSFAFLLTNEVYWDPWGNQYIWEESPYMQKGEVQTSKESASYPRFEPYILGWGMELLNKWGNIGYQIKDELGAFGRSNDSLLKI